MVHREWDSELKRSGLSRLLLLTSCTHKEVAASAKALVTFLLRRSGLFEGHGHVSHELSVEASLWSHSCTVSRKTALSFEILLRFAFNFTLPLCRIPTDISLEIFGNLFPSSPVLLAAATLLQDDLRILQPHLPTHFRKQLSTSGFAIGDFWSKFRDGFQSDLREVATHVMIGCPCQIRYTAVYAEVWSRCLEDMRDSSSSSSFFNDWNVISALLTGSASPDHDYFPSLIKHEEGGIPTPSQFVSVKSSASYCFDISRLLHDVKECSSDDNYRPDLQLWKAYVVIAASRSRERFLSTFEFKTLQQLRDLIQKEGRESVRVSLEYHNSSILQCTKLLLLMAKEDNVSLQSGDVELLHQELIKALFSAMATHLRLTNYADSSLHLMNNVDFLQLMSDESSHIVLAQINFLTTTFALYSAAHKASACHTLWVEVSAYLHRQLTAGDSLSNEQSNLLWMLRNFGDEASKAALLKHFFSAKEQDHTLFTVRSIPHGVASTGKRKMCLESYIGEVDGSVKYALASCSSAFFSTCLDSYTSSFINDLNEKEPLNALGGVILSLNEDGLVDFYSDPSCLGSLPLGSHQKQLAMQYRGHLTQIFNFIPNSSYDTALCSNQSKELLDLCFSILQNVGCINDAYGSSLHKVCIALSEHQSHSVLEHFTHALCRLPQNECKAAVEGEMLSSLLESTSLQLDYHLEVWCHLFEDVLFFHMDRTIEVASKLSSTDENIKSGSHLEIIINLLGFSFTHEVPLESHFNLQKLKSQMSKLVKTLLKHSMSNALVVDCLSAVLHLSQSKEHTSKLTIISSILKPGHEDAFYPTTVLQMILGHSKFIDLLSSGAREDSSLPSSSAPNKNILRLLLVAVGLVLQGSQGPSGDDTVFLVEVLLGHYKCTMSITDRLIYRIISILHAAGRCAPIYALLETRGRKLSLTWEWLVQQITPAMVYSSSAHFPRHRSLLPQPFFFEAPSVKSSDSRLQMKLIDEFSHLYNVKKEQLDFTQAEDDGHWSLDAYDPSFVVPAVHLILRKQPLPPVRSLANCGLLSMLLLSLSGSCPLLRSYAQAALQLAHGLLLSQTADIDAAFKERPQLLLLVDFIRNAFEGSMMVVPPLIAQFLGRSALHLVQPHHELFGRINKYLLSRPLCDFKDVPLVMLFYLSFLISVTRIACIS